MLVIRIQCLKSEFFCLDVNWTSLDFLQDGLLLSWILANGMVLPETGGK